MYAKSKKVGSKRNLVALLSSTAAIVLGAFVTTGASAVVIPGGSYTNPSAYTLSGANSINSGTTVTFDVAISGPVDPAGTLANGTLFDLTSGTCNLTIDSGAIINASVRPGGNSDLNHGSGIHMFVAHTGSTLNLNGTSVAAVTIIEDNTVASAAASTANGGVVVHTGYGMMFNIQAGAAFNASYTNATYTSTGTLGFLLKVDGNDTVATTATVTNSTFIVNSNMSPNNMNGTNTAVQTTGSKTTLNISDSRVFDHGTGGADTFRVLNIANASTVNSMRNEIGTSASGMDVVFASEGSKVIGTNDHIFSTNVGAFGLVSNSGSLIEETNGDIMVSVSKGAVAGGSNATGQSTIKLTNVQIYNGLKLGSNINDLATFGKPLDAGGNVITDPASFVAVADAGGTDHSVEASNGGHVIIDNRTNTTTYGYNIRFMSGLSNGFILTAGGTDAGNGTPSQIDVNNTKILGEGQGGYGAHADHRGVINLTDTDITINASRRNGATTYSPIRNAGTFGINAVLDGQVNMLRGSITTNNSYDSAIVAGADWGPWGAINQDNPATTRTKITVTDARITTTGRNSQGAAAALGATVELNDSPITTSGNASTGVYTERQGIVNVNGVGGPAQIKTNGDNADGAQAVASGHITLNNAAVITSGVNAIGIHVDDTPMTLPGDATYGGVSQTVVDASSSTVSTTGASGHGVYATQRGIANLYKVDVTTTGATAHGLNVDHFGVINVNQSGALGPFSVLVSGNGAAGAHAGIAGTLNLKSGTITQQTGTNGSGMMVDANGKIVFDTGTVNTTGAGAATIWMAKDATGSVKFSNGTLTSSNGPAIVSDGSRAGSRVDIINATVSGNGTWLDVHANGGAANVTVYADPSHLIGRAITDATSYSDVTIADSTLWDMTGNSNVSRLLNDNSTVAYATPTADPTQLSSYLTLTAKNYIGTNGTLVMNTYLDTDGAPSDRLVIDGGTATGDTFLKINNTTGPGAITYSDGIMVVQSINGAVTGTGAGDQTTFRLSQRVAAGAYEYLLYYGGVANPNDQNWYLRVPTEEVVPPTTGCETTGSCGSDNPTPRPEVPTNTVIVPLAIHYGYALLDTMHERIGETWITPAAPVYEDRVVWCKDPAKNFRCVVRVPLASANGAGKDETRWARSGWARLIGDRGIQDRDNFWRAGPDYNYTFGGIQAGLDIYAREQKDGTLDKLGIYVGYGQLDADVKGSSRAYYGGKAGTVDMDAYTLGGYWTHLSPHGWYTDAVVQGTWYTNTRATSVLNETIKPDGFGILGSLEAGYAFKLGNNWTLEPQAQIVYQNVTFDKANDSFGRFSFQDGDSLRGRLGVRLTKTWNTADANKPPRLITGWLRANIWHEFLGNTKTSVSDLQNEANPLVTSSLLKGTWGEIGAGVTAQVSDTVNLFATGAYHRSLDNKGSQGWDGRLGMTVKW